MSKEEALGVDVGGVIIDPINDHTDTSFLSDNYLKTTAVPGAFEVLCQLVASRFGPRVFVVSRCGAKTQAKTRHWFQHHRFHSLTGVAQSHVYFCQKWQDKNPICQALGITHFIDDRLDVLGNLETVQARYLFQPRPRQIAKFAHLLPLVKRVDSWAEVRDHLLL